MIMVSTPHLVVHLPLAVVQAIIREVQIANAARYLSAAGLVMLLYDHLLTFGDEIDMIYTAPRSYLNWVFLTNHYLVEAWLIAVTTDMSGLSGGFLRDNRMFVTALACYSIISTFVANLLGFLRVIILWDRSPRIVLGLSVALAMTFLTSVGCTIAYIIVFEPSVRYEPGFNACYMTNSSKPFIILWATPLAFDITVLAFIIYNSLLNPRSLETTLRRVLYRNGILFFLLVTLIRVVNLAVSFTTEPGLAAVPAYFSWAMITLACRRFLIHIHTCEQDAAYHNGLYASRHSSMKTDSESGIELHGYMANCH